LCRPPHGGLSLGPRRPAGAGGAPARWATAAGHVRAGAAPPSSRRSRPLAARLGLRAVEWSRTRDGIRSPDRRPTGSCKCAGCLQQNPLPPCRPTGRLDPQPAALADGAIDLAALAYRARRGAILLLYEDATGLWRCALPRAGGWRTAQRARL